MEAIPIIANPDRSCARSKSFVHEVMERAADGHRPNTPPPNFSCREQIGEVACSLVARPDENGRIQTYDSDNNLQECPRLTARLADLEETSARFLEELQNPDSPEA